MAGTRKESLYGVDVSDPAGQRAVELVDAVPGAGGTAAVKRMKALCEGSPDPSPLSVYRAYYEPAEFSRDEPNDEAFDPTEDDARTTDQTHIKRAHDAATDAGLDEAAEFLRTATRNHQEKFAGFLLDELDDAE